MPGVASQEEDLQTVEILLKMHLKPMHAQLFSDMLARLSSRRLEYCALVLRHFMHAEVASKNPFNMRSIQSVVASMAKMGGAESELAWRLQVRARADVSADVAATWGPRRVSRC